MRTQIFQKYFFLALTLIVVFIVLGFLFSGFLMRIISPRLEMLPPTVFARIVDRMNPSNKAEAIKELSSWQNGMPGPELILFDENGNALYPTNYKRDFDWSEAKKPQNPYDFSYVKKATSNAKKNFLPMPGPGGGLPGLQPVLVRLDGIPRQYLLIDFTEMPGPEPSPLFPIIGILSLVLSLALGIGATMAIIYFSVKKGVIQADNVISELQGGNLKARFQINRRDEFGQAMKRFNFMADEIEKLVNNLRNVEQARTKLLQELAHDLRTPIASLKSIIETFDSSHDKLTSEVKQELSSLALKEIEYFGRLVEDLLFLAQVKEPNYKNKQTLINVNEILTEEAEDCRLRYEHQGKKVMLEKNTADKPLFLSGDQDLIRRLFRNAFENAFSFAKSKVTVDMKSFEENFVQISIQDDGPGLTEANIESFGFRRVTRKLDSAPNGRLSVGLGSVVMRTIVEAHRGQIKISNLVDARHVVIGANIEVLLPTRS